ncbi:hypothetical protein AB0N20_16055 [Streptomyces griseoincarnatus]
MRTCSAHPSQWDAWTAESQYPYLRYRHGEGCVERHPGPDVGTPESWHEGLSAVLAEWDDGTGRGAVALEDFRAASGLTLPPGAPAS